MNDDFHAFEEFIFAMFPRVRHHVGKHGLNELLMDCPKCGAQMRCNLNAQKKMVNCYKCGGQRLYAWLEEVCGLTRSQAFNLLSGDGVETLTNFNAIVARFAEPEKERLAPGEGIKQYVSTFLPIGADSTADLLSRDFLAQRGFSIEYAAQWGLQYAMGGKFSNRLILPCWEDGVLVYFQGRALDNDNRKYYNPSADDGCYRDEYIFNIDIAAHSPQDTIYMFEGGFNGMSVGPNSLALFGKHLSSTQALKICSKIPYSKRLVIAFDYGAEDYAYATAKKLSALYNVGVLWFPDKRDMNDWHKEGGQEYVNQLLTSNVVTPEYAWSQGLAEQRFDVTKSPRF